jgi:hypothetical protein
MRPIARGQLKDGRRFGRPPDPFTPRAVPQGKINVQGYNAQAATNSKHIVIAAEVSADSPDFGHLAPMVDAAQHELAAIGIHDTRGPVGRRRLLASRPDREHHQPRHRGPDPTRRRQTQTQPALLGRRALQLHAPRPGDRPRRRALRQAPGHDRGGLRPHQLQPPAATGSNDEDDPPSDPNGD